MIKKTISYTDLFGNEKTEDLYFNLTIMELADIDARYEGGLEKHINNIIKKKDGRQLAELIKDMILTSYGEISEDGRKFIKNEDIKEAFDNSIPFEELYTELLTNEDEAEKFISGITPNTSDRFVNAIPMPDKKTKTKKK